jgi:hypothetical protein
LDDRCPGQKPAVFRDRGGLVLRFGLDPRLGLVFAFQVHMGDLGRAWKPGRGQETLGVDVLGEKPVDRLGIADRRKEAR